MSFEVDREGMSHITFLRVQCNASLVVHLLPILFTLYLLLVYFSRSILKFSVYRIIGMVHPECVTHLRITFLCVMFKQLIYSILFCHYKGNKTTGRFYYVKRQELFTITFIEKLDYCFCSYNELLQDQNK